MRDLQQRLELSPSGLATYSTCLHKWRLCYQQGLRSWENREQFAEGILMHGILEEILGRGAPRSEARDIAEALAATGAWDTEVGPERITGACRRASLALDTLYARHPDLEVEGVEIELSAPHPEDPSIILTGRLDLLLLSEGKRYLYDYKARARASRSLAQYHSHDVQATHYVAALALDDRPADWSGLLFVEGPYYSATARVVETTPTPGALSNHLATLLRVASTVRAPADPTDRTLGGCFAFGRICEYAALCAADRDGDLTTVVLESAKWT